MRIGSPQAFMSSPQCKATVSCHMRMQVNTGGECDLVILLVVLWLTICFPDAAVSYNLYALIAITRYDTPSYEKTSQWGSLQPTKA